MLIGLSHPIHAEPELGHQDHRASAQLAQELDRGGLEVQLGVYELPTAFTAVVGSGDIHVALCTEYDALPGIGHACGHNMIAAAAVGAEMALAHLANDLGVTVTIIGTPAEEVLERGGKVLLLERGAFDGVHAAMMIHPAPFEHATPPMIAATKFEADFEGKPSFRAGSLASGCNLTFSGGDNAYRDVIHHQQLAAIYQHNAEQLGRDFKADAAAETFTGSTDMGNVSALIPSIHPFVKVGAWPTANHQPDLAAACATPEADDTVLDAAAALAWTVIDLALDETTRRSIISEAESLPAVSTRARDAAQEFV